MSVRVCVLVWACVCMCEIVFVLEIVYVCACVRVFIVSLARLGQRSLAIEFGTIFTHR